MPTSRRCLRVAVGMLGLAACGSSRPAAGGDGGGGEGSDGDSGGGPAASCVGLPATCGPTSGDGCCASPLVAGGTFYRGRDAANDPNSGDLSSPATIGSFRLDRYEVTVGRFRAFVQAGLGTQASPPPAGAGAHARIAGSGWDPSWRTNLVATTSALTAAVKCNATFQTWTDAPGANEARPMNCVTWYEAMAFCAWDGGALPTEAEWSYTAAGGAEQRAYPWSSPASSLTVDGTRASYVDGASCVGDGMPGCALTDLVPVGSKPAGDGRWGQADLVGNVSEWMLDAFDVYPRPCTDCASLAAASERVVRGGNFGQAAFYMRMVSRSAVAPTTRSHATGLRCARAP